MLPKRISAFLIAAVVLLGQLVFVSAANTPTVLDLTAGAVIIGASGASVGGIAVGEPELNSAGYVIDGKSSPVSNKITIERDINVTITLRSVIINSSNILINDGAVVTLILENNNTIMAGANSAAVSVNATAQLIIRGNGALTAIGGSKAAGIGAKYGNECGDITIYSGTLLATGGTQGGAGIGGSASKDIIGNITIYGGNIKAQGTGGTAAGIGGGANRKRKGIYIYGGTVSAVGGNESAWGIGDGTGLQGLTSPVIIDAGSVAGRVQGRPQNADGTEVYRVESVLESAAEQTVTVLDEWGKSWQAESDSQGTLFSYLPSTAQLAAAQFQGKLYTAAVSMKEDDSERVVLQEYTGEPCACTAGTASFTLTGEAITVNENMGFESITLAAQFEHAEDCEYPIHGGTVAYTLDGGVSDTAARIEDNIMTVYAAADGQTLTVIAAVEIGGKQYTASASYPVTVSDAARFDLSVGNIVVNQNSVQVGDRSYDVPEGKPVYLYQENPERSVSNTIKIAEGVTRNIVFSGINIQRMGITDYAVDILGEAQLTLEGENKIFENGADHPAIRCGNGKKLTIDGTGSLTVKGGQNAAAIGGINQGTAGTIIINSGVVDVTAGAGGGAGIGGGTNGSGVTIVINGGKVFARSEEGAGIGNGKFGYGSTVKINGGMVQADGGTKGIAGTAVTIDGGSVNANNFASEQVNSKNEKVYLTTLTVDDAGTAVERRDVSYTYNSMASAIMTATDLSSKLYLYLPAGEEWVKILVNDGTKNYYKRMQISSTEVNQGICTSEPKREIISFRIPGQLSSTIDREAHTISVKMSMGAYLESLTPEVIINGSQYLPAGARDFSNSTEVPVVYTVIGDDEQEQNYQVSVTKEESSAEQPIELNISEGIIQISPSEVTVGENLLKPPHPGGYIITGTSDKNMIVISNDESTGEISFPIIFKDLTIDTPQVTAEGELMNFPPVFIDGSAVITLQGRTVLTGGDGTNAMRVPEASALKLQGDGVLNLYGGAGAAALGGSEQEGEISGTIIIDDGCIMAVGGTNAPAVGGASAASTQGKFVINGGSVHLIDGENVSVGGKAEPVSENGTSVYPMEIQVANGSVSDMPIGYQDSLAENIISLRTDTDGKLYVYRPDGTYDITVTSDGKKYYGKAEVKGAAIGPVLVDLPNVTGLQFTDPKTYRAVSVPFTLEGTFLGGEIIVIATAQDGSKVTAVAERNARGVYTAVLSLPENVSFTEDARYSITVTADGQLQTLTQGTPVVVKPKKLRITSFSVPNQIGEAVIDEGTDKITVQLPYDVADKKFAPTIVHNGEKIIPTGILDFASPTTYTILASANASGSQDSRDYTVNMVNQAAPKVTVLQFDNSLTAAGGTVDITLVGKDLDNLAYAVHHTTEITVDADGLTPAVAVKNAQGVWTAKLTVPANTSTTQAKEYVLRVSVGGELQTLTGKKTLTVPRKMDSNGEISAFKIEGQFGESLITPIDENTYTIIAYMPYGSDLTSILPYVELSAVSATYSPMTAQDFTTPVIYTVTAADGQTKVYTVTVTEFRDMVCGEIKISNPATFSGGEAVVELHAAFTTEVKAQAVAADGTVIEGVVTNSAPSLEVEEGTARISFLLPENTDIQSDAVYMLKIWLDGVEQTDLQQYQLVVPRKVQIPTSVVISNPATWEGGQAVVDLRAEFYTSVDVVAISISDETEIQGIVSALKPSENGMAGSAHVIFELPPNKDDVNAAVYMLKIWLDGVEKTDLQQYQLVVPGKNPSSEELEITGISIPKMSGQPEFDGDTITLRTRGSLREIEPLIEHTGVRITPTGVQNFREPIVYTIYDGNGKTKEYTIIIKRVSSNTEFVNWNLLPDIGSVNKPTDKPDVTVVQNTPYVNGYQDKTFRPNQQVSRAETAQILATISDKYDKGQQYTHSFVDVSNQAWYTSAVGFMSDMGIAQGDGDGTFRPEESITRIEFAAMIARFANVEPEAGKSFSDTVGNWGEGYVVALSNAGVLTGYEDGTFRPNQQVSRAEAITIINRVIGREPNKEEIDKLESVFSDVSKTHWAYYDIMAASVQYEYEIPNENE